MDEVQGDRGGKTGSPLLAFILGGGAHSREAHFYLRADYVSGFGRGTSYTSVI